MTSLHDLKKVITVSHFWRNEHNNLMRDTKPKKPTVNGSTINEKELAHPHQDYPHETLIERARRLDSVDRWTQVVIVEMQGGIKREHTGKKAELLWKMWRSKIFKDERKK